MIRIIFESHGTTIDNELGLSSGHYDTELSELGRRQAKELGERHAQTNLATVFCSDLRRSYNTAKIAFNGRDIPIIQDRRLREVDYGEMTRHDEIEIIYKKPDCISEPFPNGESYAQTTAMIKEFLSDLMKNYEGKTVMVIGHRATQYGLENLINGVALEKIIASPWHWQPGWHYKLARVD